MLILRQALSYCTPERLSVALVYLMGSTMGAFAARGMTPLQWGGAIMSVLGAIVVAVIVHSWPAKAKAPARSGQRGL